MDKVKPGVWIKWFVLSSIKAYFKPVAMSSQPFFTEAARNMQRIR